VSFISNGLGRPVNSSGADKATEIKSALTEFLEQLANEDNSQALFWSPRTASRF